MAFVRKRQAAVARQPGQCALDLTSEAAEALAQADLAAVHWRRRCQRARILLTGELRNCCGRRHQSQPLVSSYTNALSVACANSKTTNNEHANTLATRYKRS